MSVDVSEVKRESKEGPSNVLLRHPFPRFTESLPGYVLRLAELNGYKSPTEIHRLAGLMRNERSVTSLNPGKIARIANQDSDVLEHMALSSPQDEPERLFILGQIASHADLDLSGARVCPACIAEMGFIEAHWHIAVMIACSEHERSAIWFCGACRERVSWSRREMLRCRCGAALDKTPVAVPSNSELWLLDCIRIKAYGGTERPLREADMPAALFDNRSLWETLSLVRFLGRSRFRANGSRKTPFGRDLLRGATSVLEDWPRNFYRLLKEIHPKGERILDQILFDDLQVIYDLVNEAISERLR